MSATRPAGPERRRAPTATTPRRLPAATVAAIDRALILGVRAGTGTDHRFVGIWAVVVAGRVFARSWTLEPDGWNRTLIAEPHGTIQVGDRRIRIRAVRVRSERLRDAIDRAYAEKYPTPASRTYVRGFRTARRRDSTVEFTPRAIPRRRGARRG